MPDCCPAWRLCCDHPCGTCPTPTFGLASPRGATAAVSGHLDPGENSPGHRAPVAIRPHIQTHLASCRPNWRACTGNSKTACKAICAGQVRPRYCAAYRASVPSWPPCSSPNCRSRDSSAAAIGGLGRCRPLNRDSSQLRGQHRIWSSRASVHKILYMTTLTAIRAFYTRLCK